MKSDAIYRHIGALIKNRRKQLDLTQEQLAARLSMSRASLASIETGRQNVLVHQLYVLSAALGLEPANFLPPSAPKAALAVDELPLPAGLKAQQKEQIARLFLSGDDAAHDLKGKKHELETKARPQRGRAGTA